jgi:Domain of unknown function (DUF4956)
MDNTLDPSQTKAFLDFITAQSTPIPLLDFEINLLLTAALAFILGRIYVRYGLAISNRELFANNFVLLATITMVVISIVKSSLALSLGLVGALSIVRFRAAIKEPEELSYLFFAICIGLGLGANQRVIVVVAFTTISLVIWLRHRNQLQKQPEQSLYLNVSLKDRPKIDIRQVSDLLSEHCGFVDLRRYDEKADTQDVTFAVSFNDIGSLDLARKQLKEIDESIDVTFMDQSGIFN